MTDPWNRCDVCGKFIAMDDFDKGAVRHMLTPDAEGTRETWETLCITHGPDGFDDRVTAVNVDDDLHRILGEALNIQQPIGGEPE